MNVNMSKAAISRLSVEELLQKRKRFCRELASDRDLQPVRLAVLGGTTTNEVVDLLEVLLLAEGFKPTFYQSEYNKFYEDAVHEPEKLRFVHARSQLKKCELKSVPLFRGFARR